MPKSVLFLFATSLLVLSGCTKLDDYISMHPGTEHKLCRIERFKINVENEYKEVIFSYNKSGNPVSTVVKNASPGAYHHTNQYFRYDKKQRLTDYITTFAESTTALTWHRYSYPDNSTVVDTAFNYVGDIRDAEPPHYSDDYYVNHYKLDGAGRIVKDIYFEDNVPKTIQYNYDQKGNLVKDGVSYDNNYNIYRTSKVWMFIYKDFSVNNPILYETEITKYNEFRLPLSYKANSAVIEWGTLFDYIYDDLQVSYSCRKN